MSLVQKIPPMISALAFGYGVGMSAPASAISSVHAMVAPYQQEGHGAVAPFTVAPPAPPHGRPPMLTASAPGGESRELSALRDIAAREARTAASCEIDRPLFSRPPRFASTRDGGGDDVAELDGAGAEALSRLELPDLPLTVTRRTLKYVRFFTRTDRGRQMFEVWLKRSGRYQEMIQAALRDRRLPEDLMWVAMIESGFEPRAKSPVGAAGLWQFMPATGEVYGLRRTREMDQRMSPRLATDAAAHHLRDLYLRFGNWELALAAYNMGYEQLLDRIDQYGTTDFNELARQEAIPAETAAYVPKIGAAAIVANNLERFGFEHVELSRPIDAAEIAVSPGTPLKTLAKAAGVSTAAVRKLNPDILGERVPPGRGDYLLMIPADTLARAQATLPALLATEPAILDDVSVLDPVDLLGGRDFERRRARGEEESLLSLLPKPASSLRKRRALRDPVAIDRPEDVDIDAIEDDLPRPSRARKAREVMLYRVSPGDTLIGVARQFAIDVEDVARDNGLDPDDKLRAGALLKLRVRPGIAAEGEAWQPASPKEKPEVDPRGAAADDSIGGAPAARGAPQQDDAARGAPKPARSRETPDTTDHGGGGTVKQHTKKHG